MQRSIRILRLALPVVILAFIGLIVFSWTKRVAKPRTAGIEAVAGSRGNEKPLLESKQFEDTQTIGGRVVSRIRATRVVAYDSNWSTLEGVELTIYRANGLTYELSCPQAQFNSVTKQADAKGGVKVTSTDGIEIQTAEIKFDGNRLTNEIPVQFKVDRWNGNAGALDLDVQGETLRLFKQVTASMTPLTPVEPPMTLRGEDSLFRRTENTVTFTKDVLMSRGPDSAQADVVVGRFTADRKSLVGLEGKGHAKITMASTPNPGENLGGRKEIHCESFYTEPGPDGQVAAIVATSGVQIARAILEGPPRRDISARGFRISLANRAVREIKADWEVVMQELGETVREIRSDHVTVAFDPVQHRATSAFLEGGFRYSDPKTVATAFRASYDIVGDRILLTTDPGWEATVITDGQTLKAKQIEFAPRAQTAKASGDVIAQLAGKTTGPKADGTNLFPSNKPVFVNADLLTMRQAEKVAIFTGNVRAWQETNTLIANELQVTGDGSSITAKGGVRTVLWNMGTSGEVRKTPLQSTSDSLVARKNDRRIDLVGKVNIVDETRNVTSEKATFFMDANRKMERIEAENKVVVNERPSSRTGTGDKAVYHVQRKVIVVSGTPATVKDPNGALSGQQIVFDLNRNKVQVVSPTDQTKGTYKHTE
ncbi:MAG TPA: LPS export ABC transporter periplasmic protein LptC [Thermoanaerobaculia bacterium]|jgi:lipopolysaccharide transport protein LptA/LPS export ABC transporter protein LptC